MPPPGPVASVVIGASAAGEHAVGGFFGFAAELAQLQLREHQPAEHGQIVAIALVGGAVLTVGVGSYAT